MSQPLPITFTHQIHLHHRRVRYSDRSKADSDVAAADAAAVEVAERVSVITQASFPWRRVSELRTSAWFSRARDDFKSATKTEYSTSCLVEMLLTLRASQIGGSASVFNPARAHDQRTWEGQASSAFHAYISTASRLSFDEDYDLPETLLEHAVSAARLALMAGRNSRGLVCSCNKVTDARNNHATTDAEAEAFVPACTCPGWEADRGAALIPVLLVDRVFVDPIIRTLKDSSGPWRAFLSDASSAQLVLIRRCLGRLLGSDMGPIVYSNVDSRLVSPSLHDVLGLSRALKLAAVLVGSPDNDKRVHREALRQVELLSSLEANLRNPVVNRVLYFTDSLEEAGWLRRQIPPALLPKLETRSLGRQMMYSDALEAANTLFESSWTVILNADVVIGAEWANSAELPSAIEARAQRRVYVALLPSLYFCNFLRRYMLSRNELWPSKFGSGCCSVEKYNGCHDGFAFVPPVSLDLISRARFHQNHWGAENRLAWEMSQVPDALIPGNPCMSLPVYHNHASQLRQHQHGRSAPAFPYLTACRAAAASCFEFISCLFQSRRTSCSGGTCLWGCIDGREFLNNDGRNIYCMPQSSWDKGCVDHTKLKSST